MNDAGPTTTDQQRVDDGAGDAGGSGGGGGVGGQAEDVHDVRSFVKQGVSSLEEEEEPETASQTHWTDVLPSSSVWCTGDTPATRECRFRNLYYSPTADRFFIVRTNSSIIAGLPDLTTEASCIYLESGGVENHSWTEWSFDHVHPLSPAVRNVPLRYELDLTFIHKRFHALNVMHNLHDDVVVLYHQLKRHVGGGGGDERYGGWPFDLARHRIQFIDPYGHTPYDRPFRYLSRKPLRMRDYLQYDAKVITGFRDAVVGATKRTTWYQYGFGRPQGPIEGKVVNGLHVREVANWFVRRMGLEIGEDEAPAGPSVPPPDADEPSFGNATFPPAPPHSRLDFPTTRLAIILARHKNRLILNLAALTIAMSRAFGYPVVVVSNESHTFEEQVGLLRRARVVVGMHGSLMAMTMFCRRGTVVVEMFPYAVPSEGYTPFKIMAELPGMDLVYRAWENKHASASVAHPDNPPLLGGIAHLSESEQAAIRSSPRVAPHECCTDAQWLYRIYQDTSVAVGEVLALVRDGLRASRRGVLRRVRRGGGGGGVYAPRIGVEVFVCLEGAERAAGTLWVGWERAAWTGVEVGSWVVKVARPGAGGAGTGEWMFFETDEPAITVAGFEPGDAVPFAVAGVVDGVRSGFGMPAVCVV
ncbi:hypothetical protein DFJ73DRAFT_659286 [Zopfochytrium polystomum]|nr:hypothetical protein DFJ73DRAFT_659286 [Zopfochytrium polystomum]